MVAKPGAAFATQCKALSGSLTLPGHGPAGLVVVAKTEAALATLSAQFKARTVMRTYLSITLGCPREDVGQVRTNVGRHFKERKKMGVYDYGGSRWARFCLWLSTTPLPLQWPCAFPCMQPLRWVRRMRWQVWVPCQCCPPPLDVSCSVCCAICTIWQVTWGRLLEHTSSGSLLLLSMQGAHSCQQL